MQASTVQIPQPHLTVRGGTAMLVTDREGWVTGARTGLFDHDTRYLSSHEVNVDGLKPRFLTAEQPAYTCAILADTNPKVRAGRGGSE